MVWYCNMATRYNQPVCHQWGPLVARVCAISAGSSRSHGLLYEHLYGISPVLYPVLSPPQWRPDAPRHGCRPYHSVEWWRSCSPPSPWLTTRTSTCLPQHRCPIAQNVIWFPTAQNAVQAQTAPIHIRPSARGCSQCAPLISIFMGYHY